MRWLCDRGWERSSRMDDRLEQNTSHIESRQEDFRSDCFLYSSLYWIVDSSGAKGPEMLSKFFVVT